MNKTQSQHGAVLITGLIILTVMSLVGIAAMENAMVQSNLASNTQLKVMVFQETETALKRAGSPNFMATAIDEADDTIELNYTTLEGTTSSEANSTIEYCGILPGQYIRGLSLDSNQAANTTGYSHYVFDITAIVELNVAGQAQSQHTQRSSRLMLAAPGEVDNVCL